MHLHQQGGIKGELCVLYMFMIDCHPRAIALGAWFPLLLQTIDALLVSMHHYKKSHPIPPLSSQAADALAAGAIAVIIINNQSQPLMPGINPSGLMIPMSAVTLDDGRWADVAGCD